MSKSCSYSFYIIYLFFIFFFRNFVINKFNNIKLESFDKDSDNVLNIKTEIDDNNTGVIDSMLVNKDIDSKDEILTYLINDDCYETCHMEK